MPEIEIDEHAYTLIRFHLTIKCTQNICTGENANHLMPFTLDDYSITELMKKREQASVLRDTEAYKIRWSIQKTGTKIETLFATAQASE